MSVVAYDKLVKSSESDTNKILPCMLVILTKQLNYYLAQGKRIFLIGLLFIHVTFSGKNF